MMKMNQWILLFSLILGLGGTGCENREPGIITIMGEIKGLPEGWVRLYTCPPSNLLLDSCEIREGKYKLKQVGKAITFDYLKMVGIDCCKYSIQIGRLFGKNRLAIVSNEIATFEQILSIIKKLSKINKISEIEIELILQQFCLSKSANICGEFPQCEKCRLKSICNYNK